jgi:hypothetical protein
MILVRYLGYSNSDPKNIHRQLEATRPMVFKGLERIRLVLQKEGGAAGEVQLVLASWRDRPD